MMLSRFPGLKGSPSWLRLFFGALMLVNLFGCASTPSRILVQEERTLRRALALQASLETRAGAYLQTALELTPQLGRGAGETPARATYNKVCAELTAMLRNSDNGRL